MKHQTTSPQPQAVERKDKHPADESKINKKVEKLNSPHPNKVGSKR